MRGNSLKFERPIKDAITRIRFAPLFNNLLISSWDSSIRCVDVERNKVRFEANIKEGVLDCCFEDHSFALSASSLGSLFRYDLHTGAYDIVGRHEDSATCVEYSRETSQVITAGWDGKILMWDTRSSRSTHTSLGFNVNVESISLCGVELLAATGSLLSTYDLRKLDRAIQEDLSRRIRCVRSMTLHKGFAVGLLDGHVTLQSCSEKRYTFRCVPKSNKGNFHLVTVNDIAFNPAFPGGFVTGDYDGHVIAWNSSTKKRLLELPRFPNSVASLSYNHSGELLAIASSPTYQEANEIDEPPQIFIQELGESTLKSASFGSPRT